MHRGMYSGEQRTTDRRKIRIVQYGDGEATKVNIVKCQLSHRMLRSPILLSRSFSFIEWRRLVLSQRVSSLFTIRTRPLCPPSQRVNFVALSRDLFALEIYVRVGKRERKRGARRMGEKYQLFACCTAWMVDQQGGGSIIHHVDCAPYFMVRRRRRVLHVNCNAPFIVW